MPLVVKKYPAVCARPIGLSGMSIEEILDDFPKLTKADILACLAFAAGAEKQKLVLSA